MNADLAALLARAGVASPYVLVGRSQRRPRADGDDLQRPLPPPVPGAAAPAYRTDDADRADWLARQTRIASLSTKSRLIVLDHQTHYIPQVQPEVVTTAIRDLVDAARPAP